MRNLAIFLLALTLCVRSVFAGSMGAAVSGVVQMKVAQRTYSVPQGQMATQAQMNAVANDPRFTATVDGLSTAATVVAVGAGTAVLVGSSIAWGPLFAAAGISALITGTVSLAVGGLKKWLFNSDGTVTDQAATTPPPAFTTGFLAADGSVKTTLAPACATYGGPRNAGSCSPWASYAVPAADGLSCDMGARSESCGIDQPPPSWGNTGRIAGSGQAADFSWQGGSSSVTSSMSAAIPSIPSSDLSLPLNPDLVAASANSLWQRASVANPNMVPYDAANPITAADVHAWQDANPSAYPSVGDFVAPAAAPGSSTVSLPYPSSNPGTATQALPGTASGTSTNTDTGQNINLSIDWGTFSPPVIDVPSIESILDPLFNMWPDWKNFSFPPHSSSCPTPSFTLPSGVLGGRTIVFDQMCNFLESSNVRPAMQAAFAVAWAILIVFIVMGA